MVSQCRDSVWKLEEASGRRRGKSGRLCLRLLPRRWVDGDCYQPFNGCYQLCSIGGNNGGLSPFSFSYFLVQFRHQKPMSPISVPCVRGFSWPVVKLCSSPGCFCYSPGNFSGTYITVRWRPGSFSSLINDIISPPCCRSCGP